MMDRKTALDLLGVSEDASRDDISRKYSMLLKKYRLGASGKTGEDQVNIDEITKAYNFLMGYSDDTEEMPQTTSNKFSNKFSNFIYYYKIHIIVAVLLLLFAGYCIKAVVFRSEPDLNVSFIGDIYSVEVDTFKNRAQSLLPEVKNIEVSMSTIPKEIKDPLDFNVMNKANIELTMGQLDLCIVDDAIFEKYIGMGIFQNLDEVAEKNGIDKENRKVYIRKVGNDTQEHVYGIDITESTLLKESNIGGNVKIAVIRSGTKHYENAVKMLQLLLK